MGLSQGLGGTAMMAGLYLLPTALYHIVRGRSWLSPLAPSSRALAALGGIPVALALTVGGANAAPHRATPTAPTSNPAAGEVAATSASPSATTSSPTASESARPATPTPTPTPSLPSVDPNVAYATALGSEAPAAPATVEEGAKALAVLGTIPVKGRAPKTGYSRAVFGEEWYDLDRNGCDTRNDILRRDLVDQTIKPGTHGCVVLAGTLHNPYTGETQSYVRGSGSSVVEVDHRLSARCT